MATPLPIDPALLLDYPGAPFPADIVEGAGGSIRNDAGWHIAPVVTETVTVDGAGWGALLHLPTLKIVAVAAVRVYVDGAFEARTGWRIAGSGMLHHPDGWPYGPAGVEVDLSHGYDAFPTDLIPILAARSQRLNVTDSVSQQSETAGARTISQSFFNPATTIAGADVPRKYVLPSRLA